MANSGPIRIVDGTGVYPSALDQSVIEQRLHQAGRFVMPNPLMVFVFGSNEAGIHGAGAARFAVLNHGAIMGMSFGPQNNSFAIPTKDSSIRYSLPIREIRMYVDHFIKYANSVPRTFFQVTAIGCGLAGFKHMDIAPLFRRAPNNCLFDTAWEKYLPETARFWGTF